MEEASYAASTSGFFAGLVFNEWLALGGFILMVLTFGMNTYYRWKADRRDQKLQDLKQKFPDLDI